MACKSQQKGFPWVWMILLLLVGAVLFGEVSHFVITRVTEGEVTGKVKRIYSVTRTYTDVLMVDVELSDGSIESLRNQGDESYGKRGGAELQSQLVLERTYRFKVTHKHLRMFGIEPNIITATAVTP